MNTKRGVNWIVLVLAVVVAIIALYAVTYGLWSFGSGGGTTEIREVPRSS